MKIFLRITVLCAVIWSLSLFTGFTLVIPISKVKPSIKEYFIKGVKINPLKNLNFHKGKWQCYLVLNKYDLGNYSSLFKNSNCYKTSDIILLQNMQDNWDFTYTGSDTSTIESCIYLFQDDELVFEGAISLDDNEGIQNETYGWLKFSGKGALKNNCRQFKKVNYPFIIL